MNELMIDVIINAIQNYANGFEWNSKYQPLIIIKKVDLEEFLVGFQPLGSHPYTKGLNEFWINKNEQVISYLVELYNGDIMIHSANSQKVLEQLIMDNT